MANEKGPILTALEEVRKNTTLASEALAKRSAQNTRHASTVEGLETVAWRFRHSEQEKWHYDAGPQNWWGKQELVTRKNAEEVVAAEREGKHFWQNEYTQKSKLLLQAEADNAELTARVEELEDDLKTYQEPIIASENEKIDLQFKVIDLEAKLAAAEEENRKLKHDLSIFHKDNVAFEARSALEAKP